MPDSRTMRPPNAFARAAATTLTSPLVGHLPNLARGAEEQPTPDAAGDVHSEENGSAIGIQRGAKRAAYRHVGDEYLRPIPQQPARLLGIARDDADKLAPLQQLAGDLQAGSAGCTDDAKCTGHGRLSIKHSAQLET
jgi:hypothetical protein